MPLEQHLTEALIQLEAIRNMNPSKFRRPLPLRNLSSDHRRESQRDDLRKGIIKNTVL